MKIGITINGVLRDTLYKIIKVYNLYNETELKVDDILSFIAQNENNRIFIFGFTFMVYQHFIKEIKKRNIKIDLSNSVLIHGGGWKKLVNESVSSRCASSSALTSSILDNQSGAVILSTLDSIVGIRGSPITELSLKPYEPLPQ